MQHYNRYMVIVWNGPELPHERWQYCDTNFRYEIFRDLNEAKAYAILAAKNTKTCYELRVRSAERSQSSGRWTDIAYVVYPNESVRKLRSITKSKR